MLYARFFVLILRRICQVIIMLCSNQEGVLLQYPTYLFPPSMRSLQSVLLGLIFYISDQTTPSISDLDPYANSSIWEKKRVVCDTKFVHGYWHNCVSSTRHLLNMIKYDVNIFFLHSTEMCFWFIWPRINEIKTYFLKIPTTGQIIMSYV